MKQCDPGGIAGLGLECHGVRGAGTRHIDEMDLFGIEAVEDLEGDRIRDAL